MRQKPYLLRRRDGIILATGLIYLLLTICTFRDYFHWNANLIMGLMLSPVIASVEKGRSSYRYLTPAIVFMVLAVMVPVKTPLFMALLFAFLLFIESFIGRTSVMLVLLLIVVSPLFQYISNFIGFPIRLWLSEIASAILTGMGTSARADGNIILMGSNKFNVDQACAGLNMLTTSLIIYMFVTAKYQSVYHQRLSLPWTVALLLTTIGLNVASNLIRILLLVQFNIPPESAFHDIVGILCLLTYVFLPLLFFTKKIVRRFGKGRSALAQITATHEISFWQVSLPAKDLRKRYFLQLLLIIPSIFIAINLTNMDNLNPAAEISELPEYKQTQLNNGILKLENDTCLIYVKSVAWYAPEHDPQVCWKGSGYSFDVIRKEKIAGHEIYSGLLENSGDHLYSAWWFDNGKIKTIDQLRWRWDAAQGEAPFYLVNLVADNPTTLKTLIEKHLTKNLFKHRVP